jgi:hypothetical protein
MGVTANDVIYDVRKKLSLHQLVPFDVSVYQYTVQEVDGMFTAPTTTVTACYFQNINGGPQQRAATINNNSPGPDQWKATDFPTLTTGTYDLYAVGDDPTTPVNCGQINVS